MTFEESGLPQVKPEQKIKKICGILPCILLNFNEKHFID